MKKLGFGLMRLPLTDPDRQESIDIDTVSRMADVFLERGFTYFDTAYVYHDKKDVYKRQLRNYCEALFFLLL